MPYINQSRRCDLMECHDSPKNPGELNFLITEQLRRYGQAHGLSYHVMNDCLGALEGAKLEFYARVVRPYEDKKIKTNGDVY